MIENFEQMMRRMQAKGFKITLHPQDCGGKCKDCKRLINIMADKIREAEDAYILDDPTHLQ
jgi:hypothetical protein